MSDTTASLRRKITSAGDLQSVVRTMKALAARFEFDGHIEKSAGKYRWKSRDLPVLKESVRVQRSARRCSKLVLRAVMLGAVCSVLTSTVVAQEPVGKAGEPLKPPTS
ncbi:MAG TPA: hypothetical protein VED46_11340, partial [Alphaproteobacteria bacterium]|nr:hypothetical protein [Alphaproteobacteria bacterium]